jgi:membrane-associated phospholipid phosphatase
MRFSLLVSLVVIVSVIVVCFSYSQSKIDLRPFGDQVIPEKKQRNDFIFNLQPENNFFKSFSNFKKFSEFQRLSEDYGNFFELNSRRENATNLLGIGIGTTALMAFDQYSWKNTNNFYKKSRSAHDIAEVGEFLGNGKFSVYLSGAFAAYGLIWDDNRFFRTGRRIFESLLISGILVQTLKRVAGKESPASHTRDGGNFHFFPPLREYEKHQPHYYAFPSGHITSITSTLTVIGNSFPEYKWIKPVSYGLIGLVGFALVSKNMHWYSDLPLGIFIGYGVASIISPKKKDDPPYNALFLNDKLNISPYIGVYSSGVAASLAF